MHETVGISLTLAARIGMAMTGIWWAGWTLLTMKYLKEEKNTLRTTRKVSASAENFSVSHHRYQPDSRNREKGRTL